MAEGIIVGSFAGAVAGELLSMVLKTKNKTINFRKDLEQLQSTLEHVVPIFKEGRLLDLELNDRKREGLENLIKKLQKGKDLVLRCDEVSSLNIVQRLRYSTKILNLDETIQRFCQRELVVEIWRDTKVAQRDAQLVKRDINQLIEEMVELNLTLQQGRNVGAMGSVGNLGLFSVPEIPDFVVGFKIPLEELKIELFKEDLTVLGLCAPGGCGKSTLAAMLCRDRKVREKFKDQIFFVTVSRTPTLKILPRLLKEISGKEPGSDLSEGDATKQFHYLLKQRGSKPLLLVLDDVWDESVIEKFFCRAEGYKMLVTSREAFKVYNSKPHSKYNLRTLNHQDSMALFRRTALSQDGIEDYKPDEDILNKIVKCCNGFPLAIVVIARSLSQQSRVIWENRAKRLAKGASILDFNEQLQERLAASLDSLDKIRECFLDLASFPEDKRITASVLIDIWYELYELDYEDDAYVNLVELASRNLVNLVGNRKIATGIVASFNGVFVTQHDLLRDLAMHQSRENESKRLIMYKREEGLPESWRKKENQNLDARLISLCTGEMRADSWYDLQLPEAEVLILNFSASNYALPPFMEKMRKLKVLIIVNCGLAYAKLSNLVTPSELTNLKRIRLEKIVIPSFHEFMVPLRNLQKISLVMCNFGQALMNSNINVSNVLPNLVEINIDYCHTLEKLPTWICDILNLQTLSITNCDGLSALPDRIGCIKNLDLLRLSACTGLLKLPDSIKGLQKLRFLDIADCCNLNMLPDGIGELRCLKKLDMRGCIELTELPLSTMHLIHLEEVICCENTARLWEHLASRPKITVLKEEHSLEFLGIYI